MRKYAEVILDTAGNVVNGASVTVYLIGTTTKAALYSDEGVTQITNPVTSSSNGRFSFYVADGEYDLKVSGSNLTTYTVLDVQIVDTYAHISATDPHTQYAFLAGRSGGQKLIGGTAATDILKLQGTSGNGDPASPAIQLLVGNN